MPVTPGLRRDGRRRAATDAGQGDQCVGLPRQLTAMALDAQPRSRMQVAGTGVVTQSRPVRHHVVGGRGRSTAGAILSQAWNDRFPILDGNVKRVLTRFHGIAGWPGLPAVEKQLWALAEDHLRHVPDGRLADYTQAQMDFGATLCTRARPACVVCPVQDDCVARRDGLTGTLPTSKPSKVLPEREAVALWLENAEGEILLQRSPQTGIWASLWTLPQADTDAGMRDWFAREVKGTYDNAEELPVVVHTFSHYRLHLQPLRLRRVALRDVVRDNEDPVSGAGQALRWVARGDLAALGLPAPIRKLLGN